MLFFVVADRIMVIVFFFFQAEDGIRDATVTGVQTCALPISSLLERRVQVLADKAINERVPPGTWDTLVNGLIQGIKDGRPTEAFCRAIAMCGNLLAQHFPHGLATTPTNWPTI